MLPLDLQRNFLALTTPHVADAVVRLGLEARYAPASIRPLWGAVHIVGRARPARHYGSVDVFLEALESAHPGDVLVVDNAGREDEACVGDLMALETAKAGLAGIVIWGLHRDSPELRDIALPLFSRGALPFGPRRLDAQDPDALEWARVGDVTVTGDDFVLADDDGVLFLPLDRAAELAEAATVIRETERRQAAAMRLGTSLRDQAQFAEYLRQRASAGRTFREHLRAIGGAVEE
ncbi:RraA family protein [Amnibacterium flavum]|uniref:Putative 4-hydroxy-4-methyl-2-oxoglutarate aldolase n=1 Tax=Amnibacterium flavum TaxID=2173173 RepID=A0A2V1HT77_9MICO|nr:RraA family protein [Amnibacterium flavum]PVZ94170.1 dimethylmenaquinone methyltransferase [Amnibacterium flavum]